MNINYLLNNVELKLKISQLNVKVLHILQRANNEQTLPGIKFQCIQRIYMYRSRFIIKTSTFLTAFIIIFNCYLLS